MNVAFNYNFNIFEYIVKLDCVRVGADMLQ